MAKQDNDWVVFEDPDGNEISNDPRWRAQQTLAQAGVEVQSADAGSDALQAELDAKNGEIEALRQQLAAAQAQEAEDDLEDDDDGPQPDVDDNGARTYKELDGKGLKALAAERNVDISGLKKVGEVRSALIAADAK